MNRDYITKGAGSNHHGTFLLLCIGSLICSGGCFSETRTYSVYVSNRLQTPVTICMTKTFGPDEPDWLSPEQLAAPSRPATDNRPPGAVIPPGRSASKIDINGQFNSGRGRAILRVYGGSPNLSEMNAISRGSINRLDVPLYPGWNRFQIERGIDGRMAATPIDAQAASDPSTRN